MLLNCFLGISFSIFLFKQLSYLYAYLFASEIYEKIRFFT